MSEYICSQYGNCGGKCRLTICKEILDEKLICPLGIVAARPPRWIVLTDEMRGAMFDE